MRYEYRVQLEKEPQGKPYDRMMTPEDNRAAVKSCIVSAAEKVVGRRKRKLPEWFEDAADELLPLLELMNEVHTRMLEDST